MKIINDGVPLPQEHQHIHLDSSKWSNELPATLTTCLAASYWLSKLFYIQLWFVTNTNIEGILTHAYRTWRSNLSVWQLPLNPKSCSALNVVLFSRCPVRISARTPIILREVFSFSILPRPIYPHPLSYYSLLILLRTLLISRHLHCSLRKHN